MTGPALHALAAAGLEPGPVLGQGAGTVVVCTRARVAGPAARTVAVKVPLDPHDPVAGRRLRAEAAALRRFRHPHVVPLLGVIDRPDLPAALVLPVARGGSLGALLAACGPPPVDRATRLGDQFVDALVPLHTAGHVHGDIAATNVLLASRTSCWLADFEWAGREGAGTAPPMGTPGYAAPEVMGGEPPTRRADVHALAVLLVELHTGRRPAGPEEAVAALARSGVAPARRDILVAALHPDPAQRPADAAAFARTSAAAPALPVTVAFGPAPRVEPPGDPGPAARWRRATVGAAAALATAAGAGVAASGATGVRAPVPVSGRLDAVADGAAWPGPGPCPVAVPTALGPGRVVLARWPGVACPRPMAWDTRTATLTVPALAAPAAPGARFDLGAPGDDAVLGDWDGDGTDEPALYRPATGEVFRFDGWATPDAPRPTATAEATSVRFGRAEVVHVGPGRPDRVVVVPSR